MLTQMINGPHKWTGKTASAWTPARQLRSMQVLPSPLRRFSHDSVSRSRVALAVGRAGAPDRPDPDARPPARPGARTAGRLFGSVVPQSAGRDAPAPPAQRPFALHRAAA